MNTKIGFEEISDYLLGKLSPDDAETVEEAVKNSKELLRIKNDLEEKIKRDGLKEPSLSDEDAGAIYKRIRHILKRPAYRAGQIWQLDSAGKVLLIEINKKKGIARFLPVTGNTHFALSSDLVFSENSVSFLPLVAHISLASVTELKNLISCTGKVKDEFFSAIKAFEKGTATELPAGISRGDSSPTGEFEIWEEYMRAKLDKFYYEALSAYEEEQQAEVFRIVPAGALQMLRDLIDNMSGPPARLATAPIHSMAFSSFSFSHAAKSKQNIKYDVYTSDEFIIEFEDLQNALGINIILGEEDCPSLKTFKISAGKKVVFRKENIRIENRTAKLTVSSQKQLSSLSGKNIYIDFILGNGRSFSAAIKLSEGSPE